jgi:hypothetical protein
MDHQNVHLMATYSIGMIFIYTHYQESKPEAPSFAFDI